MCGCNKHQEATAACTCICDEHRNFELARDLASNRYDIITDLTKQLNAAIEEVTVLNLVTRRMGAALRHIRLALDHKQVVVKTSPRGMARAYSSSPLVPAKDIQDAFDALEAASE
jgi:hypothetical protein